MNTATQFFVNLRDGEGVSLGDLLKTAKRYGCLRYGYQIESASDEHITYRVYLQIDHKKTVCLDLVCNKQLGTSIVRNKQQVDWGINWVRLRRTI